MAGFRHSNWVGARFENFWDHRTIFLMELMASKMLSAAIKRQYDSVLPLLRHCLPVLDEICGTAMDFVFLLSE